MWAENLRGKDVVALYTNDCRRVLLAFIKALSDFLSLNLENLEDIQRDFHKIVREILLLCLPMDKANALYNLNQPWFSRFIPRNDIPEQHRQANPTLNWRYVYIIHNFNLDTEDAINDLLESVWDPNVDNEDW